MPRDVNIELCNHGRRINGGVWWQGIPPCEDCENIEWQRVKRPTIIGLAILVTLIICIPACLLLAGVFW